MKYARAIILGVVAIAAAAACGGGTDGTGLIPEPSVVVTSSGVMTKGSVILNGTRFDAAAAGIVDDRGRNADELDTGMVIKLRGRSNDGVTGLADRIDVENEVRGVIQSIDSASVPPRFTVGGLTVLVDDQTVFRKVAGFAALTVGMRVEVHGLRDSSTWLRATRIEAVGPRDGPDELRGAVSNLSTADDKFTLNGTITVDYHGAVFAPGGASEASLAEGILVEVNGTLAGNVFTANRVEIESQEDIPFRGAPGEKQEVEGLIANFTVHPGEFRVDGHSVRTTAATQFKDGTAEDLANDVTVEVEGVLDAQMVLVASKVEFKRSRVTLQGLATAVDATAGTLTVLGRSIQTNNLTRIDARAGSGGGKSDLLADVTANVDCVEVRGHMEGAVIVPERIRELNQCDGDVIQANVTGKNETNATLTFFGSLVANLTANTRFKDGMTRADFLALVREGTLVKLRGAFAAGAFTAEEAEIED
jgi:hypothetical protein